MSILVNNEETTNEDETEAELEPIPDGWTSNYLDQLWPVFEGRIRCGFCQWEYKNENMRGKCSMILYHLRPEFSPPKRIFNLSLISSK